MFDRETEEAYSTLEEKSKKFLGNSVTALDIHPLKPEYVIAGYLKGHLVLYDSTEPKKSIKVIQDHHKAPISNVKFCDWNGKDSNNKDDKHAEEKKAWMFISIDQTGKVVINSITKILFVLKASKHVVIDPSKYEGPLHSSIACRFA